MVYDFDTSLYVIGEPTIPPMTPSLTTPQLNIYSLDKNDATIRVLKKRDPELGRYTRQHIYGEGITDVFKSVGSKLFGKTMKKAAKKGVEKAVTTAATKTGEHAGKKAGDKIVQLLSKSNNKPKVTFNKNVETIPNG